MKCTTVSLLSLLALLLAGCFGDGPSGLVEAEAAATTVEMDFFHKPLPNIPMPNDIATRFDAVSATGRRVNASMVANTAFESRMRRLIDSLDGWGIFQPITIPFSGPLDIGSILAGHRDVDYDHSNDVVYLINIDRNSAEFGKLHYLDLGNGNFPVVVERPDRYWKNDPRGWTLSLMFEEADEDENGNGLLEPREDSDADGLLDRPNYLPGHSPTRDDLAGRSNALMTFYERQTHTLIARPLTPLQERTRYAVVVTRRLKDASGQPVGSPYPYINHTSQTADLEALPEVLPAGLSLSDVAFAFSYTTQSIQSHWIAVRDGLYGHGVQSHLGQNFPAEVSALYEPKDPEDFEKISRPYILYSEQLTSVLSKLATDIDALGLGEEFTTAALDAQRFVDFHAVGGFKSPQLFMRTDAKGEPLSLNEQSWPADLDRVVAPARAETVSFSLVVPRKEISARADGKPVPLVVLGHNYTSGRMETLMLGAFMAKHGMACVAIDAVSHGFALEPGEMMLIKAIITAFGLGPFFEGLTTDRAVDLNGDGELDSGGDFWTAYMFHTRDSLRQTTLDGMQLLRVFSAFDGKKLWKFDANGDGVANDIAGDFDGDGHVDVGGPDGVYYAAGPSLGGVTSLLLAAVEPKISAAVPISGGAGLGDVGTRSPEFGVPEPVVLRLMGPLFVGTKQDDGSTKVETIVVDLNRRRELHIADIKGLQPSDTVVGFNLQNGERGCSLVSQEGTFRLGVESDKGDSIRLEFYSGPIVVGEKCAIPEGSRPYARIERFQEEVTFQTTPYEEGETLIALSEGFGLPRANPRFRRALALTQLIVDPGDPISLARSYLQQPIHYPGTGEQTGAHILMTPSIGDTSVSVASGIAAARAAGLVEFVKTDPRYGMPPNQKLIETFAIEGIHNLKRYTDPTGRGVLMDIDNLSESQDLFGDTIPRLVQPMRLGIDKTDALGGKSGMLLPYSDPRGEHGFTMPGGMAADHRKDCKAQCAVTTGDDPCGCNAMQPFDIGHFMFNLMGNYLASGASKITIRPCYGTDNCPDALKPPAKRPLDSLE